MTLTEELKFSLGTEFFPMDLSQDEFMEFSNDLHNLYILTDPELYLEARVNTTKESLLSKGKKAVKGTAETTGQILGVYDDVTTGGGAIIKALWNVTINALRLIAKILKFVLTAISKLPELIAKGFHQIMNIPVEIRHKIRGNIKLYIAAGDLEYFYNTIFPEIKVFIDLTEDISKGDMWGTFFKRDVNKSDPNATFEFPGGRDDMKIHRAMKVSYNKLKSLRFEPSVIEMKDQRTVDIYFHNQKSITFTDLSGKKHESSYYDALKALVTELNTFSPDLKRVQDLVSDKLARTQGNQEFARLKAGARENIKESVLMVSRVVNIIGMLLKCINDDRATMNATLKKLKLPHSGNP